LRSQLRGSAHVTLRGRESRRVARPSMANQATPAVALRNFDMPQALLWDCDGVLAQTEQDGHRVTFNEAFKRKGLSHEWGVEEYGVLLETGGGKERMMKYFTEKEAEEPFKSITGAEERKEYVAEMHKLKTELFMEMVVAGELPLRPGVKRLVQEAVDAGVKVACCSTSNEKAVQNVVNQLGPELAAKMPVYAGDCVPRKKPDPAIYLLAAEELGVDPARCVVIEDSKIGLLAAKAAGMRCVVTKSSYTQNEDFAMADAVFDCIGDRGDENFGIDDLTTPGSFWLNPPLPVDENGNWYKAPTMGAPAQQTGETSPAPSADDGLTAEERAILADMEGLK